MNIILRKLGNLIYRVFGPSRSSLIAVGPLGNLLLKVFYGNGDKERLFISNEGIKLMLTPNDASLMGIVYLGSMNPLETKLVKEKLKPGDTFFDIGAYIDGWHSLVAGGEVGELGKVYSFEPHPKFYKRFARNLKLNKLNNIKLENLAVADKAGFMTFFPAESSSSFFRNFNSKPNRKKTSIKVKVITLDDYIFKNKIKKIDMIKIDVEGAEMLVLKGANRTLQRDDAPDLLIEVVDSYLKDAGSSEKELIGYLRKFGYKAYTLDFSGLRHYKIINSSRNNNLFFSKKKQDAWL